MKDRIDIAECTREEELCLAAVDQPVVSRQEEEVVVCDAAGASALRMTREVVIWYLPVASENRE